MGKLYSYTYMSLDGVTESPEKWSSPFFSEEMGQDLTTRLQSAAAMVLGRQTYTEFADFWPKQPADAPFVTLNNSVKKYVVSHSLKNPAWNNTSVVTDAELPALKASAEGDLHITGSGTLVGNWINAGLIDEVRILVCPVIVGEGTRLYATAGLSEFKLVESKPFPLGVLSLVYQPGRK